MNICEKKNQIHDLLNDVFSEYNRMNETKIQSKCETDLEMRTMISNIRSLEASNLEKDVRIKNLEKTINDYDKMINDLNMKLEIKEECDKESNRHDMLRIQAKEITEKDREILRLNRLLDFHKKEKEKEKSKKLDTLMNVVTSKKKDNLILNEAIEPVNEPVNEPIEPVNEETGEVNPNLIYDKEEKEPEPSPGGSIHSPDIKVSLPEDKAEPEDGDNLRLELAIINSKAEVISKKTLVSELEVKEVKVKEVTEVTEVKEPKILMKMKAKGIQYFVYKGDNPQDMYEYNEEKRADKIVGKRTKIDGKYKNELF